MEKIIFTSMNPLNEAEIVQLREKDRLEIEHQLLPWGNAWNELLKVALYNQGPDVSEIGSTWIGSLLEMNALLPIPGKIFSLQELKKSFYPAAYQGVLGKDEKTLLGVPWLTDTRMVYYRRSLLKKAGIDEKRAFVDSKALVETLGKLQKAGIETPLAMATGDLNPIYISASWIWNAGGKFRDEKGKLALSEPKAQAGLLDYFSLHPFMLKQTTGLRIQDADLLFRQGEAAVVISGPWLFNVLQQEARYFSDLGIAKIPGIPFVGGTHLVIWAHCLTAENVLQKFIRFLTSIEIQSHFVQKMNLSPARLEVLSMEPFASSPFYGVLSESLSTGRVVKITSRWAAVEQRLMLLLNSIWTDLAKNPDLDLKKVLYERTDAVASRLNSTILATISK